MRVLVVEDDPDYAELVRSLLRVGSAGLVTSSATTVAGAVAIAAAEPVDVVLLDLGLPDAAGVEAVRRFVEACPAVPVVVLTAVGDADLGRQAVRAGAQDELRRAELTHEVLHRTIGHAVARQQAVHEAVARNAELALIGRMFEEFAHTVAHDVRRPLTTMQMLAETIASGRSGAIGDADLARRIADQAGRLLGFTDDLLRDAGRVGDELRVELPIGRVVDRALDLLETRLDPETVVVSGEDEVVWAREGQLVQVLLNLLGNVVRHAGDDPKVAIAVEPGRDGSVRVVVDDDGPGVPLDARERVRAPGVRLGDDPVGHGLGLAAVDLVMRAHGGELELDESPLGGLRVVLTFPPVEARVIDLGRVPAPETA